MVRFDWSRILDLTQGRLADIIAIFQHITFEDVPTSRNDPMKRYVGANVHGNSFLVNPWYLLANVECGEDSLQDAVEYIAVASLRSLHDLFEFKQVYLPVHRFPEDLNLISGNRLMRIDNNRILFKYEFEPLG